MVMGSIPFPREGDPQISERLCVQRKTQELGGGTERERSEEIHKGVKMPFI